MQHGPRGPPRMQFRRDFPPTEDPAREKAVRSIFGNYIFCSMCVIFEDLDVFKAL